MKTKKKPELADDQMCFGCGKQNARGLQLHFDLDVHKRRIRTRWMPSKEFQGYADIIHGGIISLILDELMVNLLWTLRLPAVTAELNVRFRRPAWVGQPLDCEAWVGRETGRLFHMEARARTSEGELIASATAKCIR